MSDTLLFRSHPAPIWIMDPQGERILACNAAACSVLGLPEARILEFHPRDLGLLPQGGALARIGAPGREVLETELDGEETFWNGQPARIVIATRTDAAMIELGKRYDMMRKALATAQVTVSEADPTTGQMRFPPEALRAFGLPDQPVSIPDILAMIHPEDRPRYVRERDASIAEGTLLDTIVRVTKPGGDIRHLRVIAGSAGGDSKAHRYGLFQDVTDSHNASEAYRRTQALLDLASGLARLGGWRIDVTTGAVEATAGAREVYGTAAGESFDLDQAMACYSPADRARIFEAHAEMRQDSLAFDGEFPITALDGTPKWIRVTQRPEVDAEGRLVAVVGAVQDFSEIVALRSEANVQAQRVQTMIENMPDAFFMHDREVRFTYANPAGKAMLASAGVPEDAWLGRTLWEVMPILEPQLREAYEQMLRDGRPLTRQVEVTAARSTGMVDAYLTPDGIGVHVRDVTQEVRAQEMIRSSEERYRLALKASQDVLFDWDIAENRLSWSEAALHCFGYDPSVFPRTRDDWLSIIHPEDRDRVATSAQLALLDEEADGWTETYRLQRADGSVAHVRERGQTRRSEDGEPVRMIGTIIDMTEMIEEERRLRAIVDVASDAIYEYDQRRGTIFFSEGIRTTFGHDWVGSQPIPSPWQEMVHPDDQETLFRAFLEFCSGDATRWRCEYRLMRADGTYATVREKGVAMRDGGTLIRVVGSIEDVTFERRAEERMKQADRIDAIGKLTGGVAHDFNNLLTVILGNAELLDADERLDEESRGMAAIILRAAERGAELTAGLLAFAGRQPLAPKTLDTRQAIAEIERLLRRTLPADIRLQIILKPNLWLVEADPAQMNAAILNLSVNARDAMPGGGKLMIECANARLDASYAAANPDAASGDFLRIAVTDTGTGMSPEVVAHAFEPFFTTKPKGAGTGMGLSMVRGFVQQSGGHVTIYTEPGHGTTVSIYLPRSIADTAESPDASPTSVPLGKGEHVLIVEDNALLLPHVRDMVAGLGYRVSIAPDAAEAMAVLRRAGDVDVLFTDVVMPGEINGPALAKLAKAGWPELKVLYTSGYTENAIMHHGRLDTGVQLLSKPYRRHELAMKLRQVIQEG